MDLEPGDVFFLYTDGIYGSGHGENPQLAAKRLAEAAGMDAQTIHRLLGYDPPTEGFAQHGNQRPIS